jgi:hypothetical protein
VTVEVVVVPAGRDPTEVPEIATARRGGTIGTVSVGRHETLPETALEQRRFAG